MDTKIDFKDPAYYENRELSWIKFDQRVLSEARDKSIPLLERLKFVSITSSNLDEFFMVRVASLKDMVHAKYKKRDIAGMTATEQLSAINKQARELVNIQYSTFSRSLMPLLHKEGIYLLDAHEDLSEEQARFVDRYFMENVYPVLTPMAVDASRPFPLIRNKTLNIAALLSKKNTKSEKQELDCDRAGAKCSAASGTDSKRRGDKIVYSPRADHRTQHRHIVFQLQGIVCISVPDHAKRRSDN